MEAARKKQEIQTLDDLFGIPPKPDIDVPEGTTLVEAVVSMPIEKISDIEDHPFRVKNDRITQGIVEDIRSTGQIETPAVVRPVEGGYEMISGHRRKLACQLAGLDAMPVIIRNLTKDQAIIAMVRANKQREDVLPSEKAFAYKMLMAALNRQGQRTDLTSAPLEPKLRSNEEASEQSGESVAQIKRYIRLTELIPELLEMVDNMVIGEKGVPQIAFRPAVELSYLSKENQNNLLLTIQSEDRTPSLSQAMMMKEVDATGKLDMDRIFKIMLEDKPNQKETFKIPQEKLSRFFAPGTPADKVQDTIVKALELYQRHKERQRNDAR